MPDRYRARLIELAELCREMVDTLASARAPGKAQASRFSQLLEALRPSSAADPFHTTWNVLEAAETMLAITVEEESRADQSRRALTNTLRGAILDLDVLLKSSNP